MDDLVHLEMEQREEAEAIEIASGAMSLDFLQAIYRSPAFPTSTRMRAAQIAIPYEFPRLAITATMMDDGSFAARLDRAIQRSALAQAGKVKTIEAKSVEHSPAELRTRPIRRRV
jgi:hypothetical protein